MKNIFQRIKNYFQTRKNIRQRRREAKFLLERGANALEALLFIEHLHKKLQWSRQRRRQWWNQFFKYEKARVDYLNMLLSDIQKKQLNLMEEWKNAKSKNPGVSGRRNGSESQRSRLPESKSIHEESSQTRPRSRAKRKSDTLPSRPNS